MSYVVAFCRDFGLSGFEHGVTIGKAETIDAAKELRHANGDLVFCADTGNIVQDTAWLWDWEKENLESYAWKRIVNRARLSERAVEEIARGIEQFTC